MNSADMIRRAIIGKKAQTPTEQIIDTFNRADADTLGYTETGQLWQYFYSTWGIVSNKAIIKTKSGDNMGAYVDSSWNNVILSSKTTYTNYVGLLLRITNMENCIKIRLSSSGLGIFRSVSNTPTTLGTYAITPTVGTEYTISVNANGNNLLVYLNGTLVITATDSVYSSNTKHGIYSFKTTVPTDVFDDFTITKL